MSQVAKYKQNKHNIMHVSCHSIKTEI